MITRLPVNALQQAVYTRLVADLAPVLVFDDAPETVTWPYVELEGFSVVDEQSTKTTALPSVTLSLNIYSREAGYKELDTIGNKVIQSIASTELVLTDDFAEVFGLGRLDFYQALKVDFSTEGLGIVRQGAMRYRWLIEDKKGL